MTPAERALLLAVAKYINPERWADLAQIDELIAAVEAEADTTPETDDENEIAEEWDHMSGEIGRPDTTSWDAWYEGVPVDLKRKLSFHDLRRLGRHAVAVFLATSAVEAEADKSCDTKDFDEYLTANGPALADLVHIDSDDDVPRVYEEAKDETCQECGGPGRKK